MTLQPVPSLFKSKPTLASNKIFKQWNYIKSSFSLFQEKKQDTLKFQQQDAITRKRKKKSQTNGQLIKKSFKTK